MNDDIFTLIESYKKWLKNEIRVNQFNNGWNVIHTPFLNYLNDNISLYVNVDDDNITISDDKETCNNLEMSGLSFTDKRKEQVHSIANRFQVQITDDYEIIKHTTKEDFSQDLNETINAVIDIDNLYLTTQDKVVSYFKEDVMNYLRNNKIHCIPDVILPGKTGFRHNYDFIIQGNDTQSERLCNILDKVDKSKIISVLFAFSDTKEERQRRSVNSKLIIIINDKTKISASVIEALKGYGAEYIPWSKKETIQKILS